MQDGMDSGEAGAEAAVAADFIGHSLPPPVLFTKTVLRAAARTAVVRVRGCVITKTKIENNEAIKK